MFATTPFEIATRTATEMEAPSALLRAELPRAMTLEGFRGGRVRLFGGHASAPADKTLSVGVYAIERSGGIRRSVLLGTLAATLGTLAGQDHADISKAERWADTIVWTPTAYGTALLGYVGAAVTVHSPADDTMAEVFFEDFGNVEQVYFRLYDIGGGGDEAESAGVYLKLDR